MLPANIARAQEETAKFAAEQRKISAEADKLNRHRWLAPVVAVSAILGGGIVASLPLLLHWLGAP